MHDLALCADFYHIAFPKYPPLQVVTAADGLPRIEGTWFLGQCFKTSGYYGAFPGNLLKRIMSMFPAPGKVLHLFSGSLPPGDYIRFDLTPGQGDVCGDAHELDRYFPEGEFGLVVADPPYAPGHATKWGHKMIDRRKVWRQAIRVLKPGGWLMWLDTTIPLYRKDMARLGMAIAVWGSTNHVLRGVMGWRKR